MVQDWADIIFPGKASRPALLLTLPEAVGLHPKLWSTMQAHLCVARTHARTHFQNLNIEKLIFVSHLHVSSYCAKLSDIIFPSRSLRSRPKKKIQKQTIIIATVLQLLKGTGAVSDPKFAPWTLSTK